MIDNDNKLFNDDGDTEALEGLFDNGGEGDVTISSAYDVLERIMKKLNRINEKLGIKT